jgi:Na+-transporting methylmalonyl-CoA/oxaloacetate decarboxylase gamma subunit
MNPQILFNFSLAFLITGLILLFKGIFILGFGSLIIAIGASVIWLMSGFFGKFEYEPTETKSEDEKDEEGKGVLKPF